MVSTTGATVRRGTLHTSHRCLELRVSQLHFSTFWEKLVISNLLIDTSQLVVPLQWLMHLCEYIYNVLTCHLKHYLGIMW